METKYDILVIGSGFSGLVSAVLLAKKGFRVAIVSDREQSAVREKDGYIFNDSPLLITGLHDGPLKTVSDEVGLPKIAVSKSAVSYQVVLPDERISVYQDRERFCDELKRCFPSDIDKINMFYNHLSGLAGQIEKVMDLNPFSFRPLLPLSIMKGKRPINKLMKGLALPQKFHSFIDAQLASFSYLDAPVSSISASSLLEAYGEGVYSGVDGLKELFLQRFKALGGDVIRSAAKDVAKNGNRWLLRTDEEAISGRAVIGNMDVVSFCSLFLDIGKKYLKKTERIERSHYPLKVNIGVRESGIPVGMADNVILLRDYQKGALNENLLYLQMAPATNGRRSVSIRCHVQADRLRKEEIRKTAEGLLEGVEWLCPFIDRHVELLDISNTDVSEGRVYSTTLAHKMGLGILPHEIIGGEVFFAGPEIFPSLGFDGLIYSGKMAAAGALKSLNKEAKRLI